MTNLSQRQDVVIARSCHRMHHQKNSGVCPAQLRAISTSLKQVARHQQQWHFHCHFGYGPFSEAEPLCRQTSPRISRRSGEGHSPGTIILQHVSTLRPRWGLYQSLMPTVHRTVECRVRILVITDSAGCDDVSNRNSIEGEDDRSENRALRHTRSTFDCRRFVPTELHILVPFRKVGFYPIEFRFRHTKPTSHTFRRISWPMVSKAADMSNPNKTVIFLLSIVVNKLSRTLSRAVSVEWPVRYADCNTSKLSDSCMCCFNLPRTSLSMIFDIVLRLEIGR